MPDGQCTRKPRVRNKTKHTSVVTTGPPDSPGIPARHGFNGLFRALPGDRAFLSPSFPDVARRKTRLGLARLRKLDAGVEASGPHDFAVRSARLRQRLRRAQVPVRRSFSEGG